MLSASKLKNLIGDKLQEWFSPLGFECKECVDGVEAFRWDNGVYMFIACTINRNGGNNCILPFGQMGFKETKEIYQRFMLDPDLPYPDRSVDLTIKYPQIANNWTAKITCNEVSDLDGMYLALEDVILNKLYPLLKENTDPTKLVDLYLEKDESNQTDLNVPAWHGYSSALTGLILSKLYAPQFYKKLKKRYKPIFETELSQEETKNKVNRLIQYLESYHS